MSALTSDPMVNEVLALLNAIDRGEVTLEVVDAHVIEPIYRSSNGWHLRVFNDCGGWDYLDAFQPPEGEWVDVDVKANPALREVLFWRPYNLKAWHWGDSGPGGHWRTD